jgi:hypothetical protein
MRIIVSIWIFQLTRYLDKLIYKYRDKLSYKLNEPSDSAIVSESKSRLILPPPPPPPDIIEKKHLINDFKLSEPKNY